ncbi:hypothetical protein [Thiohalophilus sp.]|uniref:hypothetical protein n=1 Tax=Thiohalophilus sp. TaxID=3028392 RepID=UPI002ACE7559|nr:hypothetical protein [Thiohalophilus sp.]MDZ7804706.1 hypothetical protein [Thiohalophilus sp.]
MDNAIYIGLALLGIGCVVVIALTLNMIAMVSIAEDDDAPLGYEAGDPTDTITQEESHRVT